MFEQGVADIGRGGVTPKPTVVVIGSGFGGSVFACRLAERQEYIVHVLERGRRYGRNEFPRRPDQLREAFWDPGDGRFGLFEYHSFAKTDIDVWTCSGVGGGSLIYANILYEMPPGWPGGIRRHVLDPYYHTVLNMMEARPYPVDQPTWPYAATPKTQALMFAYERLSAHPLGFPPAKLEWPHLAVQFGPRPGEEFLNQQGVKQTTCRMCGECSIGCNYHAKNTLDLNYLARAERFGAVVHEHAEVRAILPRPSASGYTVVYSDPRRKEQFEKLEADFVVVAAGSLGSTKLLLRMKHSGQLPHLSPALGTKWCGNGDLLGMCLRSNVPIYPSTGPTITGAVHFYHSSYQDGFPHGLYVEDAAIPNMLAWYITAMKPTWRSWLQGVRGLWRYLKGFLLGRREVNLGDDLGPLLFRESQLVSHTLVFLGMGRDRSTGIITLRPERPRPISWPEDCDMHLAWDSRPSELHFDRLRSAMRRITAELGGTFEENPVSYLNKYVAVHPLGGCPMGDNPQEGVVDACTGEVFGHKGLYVVDGSIIPTATGPNPSLTIAAVAEMLVERFP